MVECGSASNTIEGLFTHEAGFYGDRMKPNAFRRSSLPCVWSGIGIPPTRAIALVIHSVDPVFSSSSLVTDHCLSHLTAP